MMDNSFFSLLNSNYKDWSVKNVQITDITAESMMAMSVELTIDGRTCSGVASMYKDFSKDITAFLLEKALYNAYNNIYAKSSENKPKGLQISKESIERVNNFKEKYNVVNDTIFNDYVAMWNKECTKQTLLTVEGKLEEFLDFIEKLENK